MPWKALKNGEEKGQRNDFLFSSSFSPSRSLFLFLFLALLFSPSPLEDSGSYTRSVWECVWSESGEKKNGRTHP